jgi:predicted TIM-barrel fold metal-dependent hydrolase
MAPMAREVIDIHVHFGAPEDPETGCYWSERFERTIAYLSVRLVTRSVFKRVSVQTVTEHMLGVINGARYVQRAVLLALDEVYDPNGRRRRDLTHLHVPNSLLAGLARQNPRVLFGASVHPLRPDWERELEFCLENRAVLCKWIPSAQQIDASSPRVVPFYRRLAESGLPLLCHVGPEEAVPPFDSALQRLNRPDLLRPALDAGVTVIMAHAALPVLPPPFESSLYFNELVALFRRAPSRGWKLYADVSSFNLVPPIAYLNQVRAAVPSERLVLGSDYPIPILGINLNPRLGPGLWLRHFARTLRTRNPLDKNYLLVKDLGLGEGLLTRASEILRLA